jgi:predicted RNase H-like HicB family nuclease
MLRSYIDRALQKAEYKQLADGSWFAEIPGLEGVWANGASVEKCRNELSEVLEEWLVLKIHDHDEIPSLDGIQVKVEKKVIA